MVLKSRMCVYPSEITPHIKYQIEDSENKRDSNQTFKHRKVKWEVFNQWANCIASCGNVVYIKDNININRYNLLNFIDMCFNYPDGWLLIRENAAHYYTNYPEITEVGVSELCALYLNDDIVGYGIYQIRNDATIYIRELGSHQKIPRITVPRAGTMLLGYMIYQGMARDGCQQANLVVSQRNRHRQYKDKAGKLVNDLWVYYKKFGFSRAVGIDMLSWRGCRFTENETVFQSACHIVVNKISDYLNSSSRMGRDH